ncbi:MAG: choice-of-anchor tandem repeat GloVer-containing protein [Rhizomicrobium sp.]
MRSTFVMTAAAAALLCASGTAAFAGKTATETAIYSFAGGNDGGFPQGGLVANARGKMFGVTTSDGSGHNGVIFEVDRKKGAWTETALYAFTGGSDGGVPQAGLMVDSAGNLYGTTYQGGSGYGVVFELSRGRQKTWDYHVLWTFSGGTDGGLPSGRLTMDANGNLYGTATEGGTGVVGTVFELSPPANGSTNWTETILYNFTGNNDGGEPMGNVLLGNDGNIYGTTAGYGQDNYGVIYKLTPANGAWSESVLHAFQGSTDGEVPRDGLIQDANGTLYGTTAGFNDAYGNVFSLNTDGSNYTVLYNIPACQGCYTGNGPWQTVTMDSSGALYGTTLADGENNNGEVFKLTPGQNNQWTPMVLYAFQGGAQSQYPYSTVLIGKHGKLYGTSQGSGGQNGFYPGNVWRIKQ